MVITEYEGVDHAVLATCDRCGFRRWLFGRTVYEQALVRCDCPAKTTASSRTEAP